MLIRSIKKTLNTTKSVPSLQMYTTETSIGFSALENRILKNGDPKTSITPILNQWVEQGREVTQPVLHRIVTRLANYRRFSHALQVKSSKFQSLLCFSELDLEHVINVCIYFVGKVM
jgi:hypothetical protein